MGVFCRGAVCVEVCKWHVGGRRFCSPALPAVGLAGDICSTHVPPVIAGLTADVLVLGSLSEPTVTAPWSLLMSDETEWSRSQWGSVFGYICVCVRRVCVGFGNVKEGVFETCVTEPGLDFT